MPHSIHRKDHNNFENHTHQEIQVHHNIRNKELYSELQEEIKLFQQV